MPKAHVCTLEIGSLLWVQISPLCFELVANAGEDQGSSSWWKVLCCRAQILSKQFQYWRLLWFRILLAHLLVGWVTSVTKQSPSGRFLDTRYPRLPWPLSSHLWLL